MSAQPTEADREKAEQCVLTLGTNNAIKAVAQALAEQRAKYEAVADELHGSKSLALDEGVRRGYNRAAKYAARRIRQVSP